MKDHLKNHFQSEGRSGGSSRTYSNLLSRAILMISFLIRSEHKKRIMIFWELNKQASRNQKENITLHYKSACFPPSLCARYVVPFSSDLEILVNSSWYSLASRIVAAEIWHFTFAFSFSELSLYPLLTPSCSTPSNPPPRLDRVSLVRATCLWHRLKIRFPIKPWKVESGGRMCVCVWWQTLYSGGFLAGREPVQRQQPLSCC